MFNVGDIVKCIESDGNSWITKGYAYKVINVYGGCIYIVNDGNVSRSYNTKLFELISSSVEENSKELEEAVKVLHKYGCSAEYSCRVINKGVSVNTFEWSIKRFVEEVFDDHKSPQQIEAEEITQQMKKLEERLKELAKKL